MHSSSVNSLAHKLMGVTPRGCLCALCALQRPRPLKVLKRRAKRRDHAMAMAEGLAEIEEELAEVEAEQAQLELECRAIADQREEAWAQMKYDEQLAAFECFRGRYEPDRYDEIAYRSAWNMN